MSLKVLWVASGVLLALILGCSSSSTTGPAAGPSINISDARTARGHPATFTVSMSVTSSSPVIFHYTTGGGTAVAGTDYATATGLDTIAAATLSATITINTIRGTAATGAMTFNLTLSGATNATLNDSLGVCTIEAFGGAASFATDIRPALQNTCAGTGCHDDNQGGGSLNLGTFDWTTVRAAIGAHGPIIAPASVPLADSSDLYREVQVTTPPPYTNGMPKGQLPWSSSQIQKLKDWIDEGALNN